MVKKLLFFFSFVITIFFSTPSYCITPEKAEKKLNKLYQSGNFYKLEKKALKYNRKESTLDAPYYYLSKIEIDQAERIPNQPNKRQWPHLRRASQYASKLKSKEYIGWQDSVANIINTYGLSLNSTQNKHKQKVQSEYDKYLSNIQSAENKTKTASNNTSPKKTSVNSTRKKIISAAEKQLGVPYKYAAESPGKGFDCSGFVKYAYSKAGITLPHNAHMQSQMNGKKVSLDNAKPGDIIFFGSKHSNGWRTQHSGIVYGHEDNNILFIHASSSRGIVIDGNNPSWNSYWKSRVLFVKRLPELK